MRRKRLSIEEVIRKVTHSSHGAVATFAGVVRDSNEGLPVVALEYHAYVPMAEREMRTIASEITLRYPMVRLAAIHRIGKLRVGDLAIVCAASSPHRGEAFLACKLLIDEIKHRVPIWKREHGPKGPYWIGWKDATCHPSHGTGASNAKKKVSKKAASPTKPRGSR
ncbi:MAG: molybdenum cofactor biosynthesis protein MoaE [Polyangiaceae bacterium]|nr:molybdenum cofactor biosynthesis protein MoaE [Polyangiaceae bacterium]